MMPISSISSTQLALSPRLELFAACAVTTTPLSAGALTAAVKQLAAASKGSGAAGGDLAGLSVRLLRRAAALAATDDGPRGAAPPPTAIPVVAAVAAVWAATLRRTPLASAVRSHANASFPGTSPVAGAAAAVWSPRGGGVAPSSPSAAPLAPGTPPPPSPRTTAAVAAAGGVTDEGGLADGTAVPSAAPSGRAAVAVARHAQDGADAGTHVRRQLTSLLATAADAAATLAAADAEAFVSFVTTAAAGASGGDAPSPAVAAAAADRRRPAFPLLQALRVAVTSSGGNGSGLRVTVDGVAAAVSRALVAAGSSAPASGTVTPPLTPATPTASTAPAHVVVRGLRRATVADAAGASPSPLQLPLPLPAVTVVDCVDATVLQCFPSASASIVGCVRTTVLLGPTAGLVAAEGCEGCILIVCGAAVTLANCVECEVLAYSANSAPLLIGDCRGLRLGPYAARYAGLAAHVAAAGLGLAAAAAAAAPVAADAGAGGAGDGGSGGGGVWEPLPPSAFTLRAGVACTRTREAAAQAASDNDDDDASSGAAGVPPLPAPFAAELTRRATVARTLRAAFEGALGGPPPPAAAGPSGPGAAGGAAALQRAVQASFGEWLRESGAVHRVAELMRAAQG